MTGVGVASGADARRPIKLSCRDVWKIYGPHPSGFVAPAPLADAAALRARITAARHVAAVMDVSFDVHEGEIFVIMGLSGSGKSTIVRCLSRLVEPTSGHVLLDGEDLLAASPRRMIEIRRRAMGMVFQNFGLLPHLSVLDNVAFPLAIQGQKPAQRLARAREMVELVGLAGREDSLPHQLSGGQQQRVGIARSLAAGPELWFLDEPFSALDPLIRRQMQDEFLRLQRLLNKTIVFITHDIGEAFRLADRIAIMRDGVVIQIGTPSQIALDPADDYVAAFTEDVPLVRVIHASDVMTPGDDELLEPIAAGTALEALVPLLAAGSRGFRVVDAQGEGIGHVTAAAILDVLARDRARRRAA